MRQLLTPAAVTPEQLQVIHKAVTLIDYSSFFANHSEQFGKLKAPFRLQAKAIQSVGCVELYYMELRMGTSILGGFVFAVVPLDAVSLLDECGQHATETLLAQWAQLATTHRTYALQLLCFLPEHLAFNAAIVQVIVCKLQQELERQGGLLAAEHFSQLLKQAVAVADYK